MDEDKHAQQIKKEIAEANAPIQGEPPENGQVFEEEREPGPLDEFLKRLSPEELEELVRTVYRTELKDREIGQLSILISNFGYLETIDGERKENKWLMNLVEYFLHLRVAKNRKGAEEIQKLALGIREDTDEAKAKGTLFRGLRGG